MPRLSIFLSSVSKELKSPKDLVAHTLRIPPPRIFISAVSKELKSARQLVAQTLRSMGYESVDQEILGTEQGDVRAMLREKIDRCGGVIQLVGQCYGAEPAKPAKSDRVSYTQYEAIYAREKGKSVWYFILHKDFTSNKHESESTELTELQASYRERLTHGDYLYYDDIGTSDRMKLIVMGIGDKLEKHRKKKERLCYGGVAILVGILAMLTWLVADLRSEFKPTVEKANVAFLAKDFARAFDVYARLSYSDPADVSYHRRIEECARLGRLEKPFLEHYLNAIAKSPQRAILHNYLGNAFLMIDDRDRDGKARTEYEEALRLDPQLALPLANLAIITYRSGKTDEAEALFHRYLSAQPDDAQGWVNLGMLYVAKAEKTPGDKQAAAAAEQTLRKAVRMEPGLASAYKGLGRLYAAAGRKEEALQAYQRSLALNFEQPFVRQQIELLAWESAGVRPGAAQADDFKTRSVNGRNSETPLVIAALRLLDQRRFSEAAEVVTALTQREPNNPLGFRLLDRAYEGQGRIAEARAASAQADQLSRPGSGHVSTNSQEVPQAP